MSIVHQTIIRGTSLHYRSLPMILLISYNQYMSEYCQTTTSARAILYRYIFSGAQALVRPYTIDLCQCSLPPSPISPSSTSSTGARITIIISLNLFDNDLNLKYHNNFHDQIGGYHDNFYGQIGGYHNNFHGQIGGAAFCPEEIPFVTFHSPLGYQPRPRLDFEIYLLMNWKRKCLRITKHFSAFPRFSM